MPITLTPVSHEGVCIGNRWQIADYDKLVSMISRLAMGSYLHVERVINQLASAPPSVVPTAAEQARRRLSAPTNEPQRYHRDGWIFLMISWIAAQVAEPRGYLAAPPHCRVADKGFDCILIPTTEIDTRVESVILCEDKATDNPRNLVTQQIWPEIVTLEGGGRDAELISEVTTLLRGRVSDEDVERITQGIYWDKSRHYRVSLTLPTSCSNNSEREAVFNDYDVMAPGTIERRRAESLELANLRTWMDQVAADCLAHIQSLSSQAQNV